MTELAVALLVLAGAGFALVAAIGVWRLPDAMMRMHASSKAGTLGGSLLFIAVALGLGDLSAGVRAIAGIAFLLLTAPVASHLIGRATYLLGVPRHPSQTRDDLEGRYDLAARICRPPEDRSR
ncbi:monovalent cation/H(+) antiporter subunit G [Elioraea tepida]|jgi:multicomponent Na+:H+ antiporter subunit G|uniref:Monovalent cation/H(+) antiporter subunit G n=1 Tax=Elioraea tepida TaxID=2843330 RepID=A0A975U1T7_9PROT|nr:monovalent cation/H(+) antiporter subunit G [Elioraea tepida]QXM23808.1 monovalent cation/H(+) antiporter subunit G [Elioraea tepida]